VLASLTSSAVAHVQYCIQFWLRRRLNGASSSTGHTMPALKGLPVKHLSPNAMPRNGIGGGHPLALAKGKAGQCRPQG
jgi:hypothetical protein